MSGQLCLKWNNHGIAFGKLFHKIYLQDVYSDGTILCHGKFYPVHRLVLSTCSEYFEKIFHQCDHLRNKHPFIIVKDILPDEMEALLNYMYRGEVNVTQEMLPDLIKAAEALKIKGLAVPDEEPSPKLSRKRSNVSSPPLIQKKSRKNEDNSDTMQEKNCNQNYSTDTAESKCNNDISTSSSNLSSNINTEPEYSEIKAEPLDYEESRCSNDTSDKEEISLKVEKDFEVEFEASSDTNDFIESAPWDKSPIYRGDHDTAEEDPDQNLLDCSYIQSSPSPSMQERTILKTCYYPDCNYKSKKGSHMKRHLLRHTGEKPFKCPVCSFKSATKFNVTEHLRTVHSSEKPYNCPYCKWKSAYKKSMKRHVLTHAGASRD